MAQPDGCAALAIVLTLAGCSNGTAGWILSEMDPAAAGGLSGIEPGGAGGSSGGRDTSSSGGSAGGRGIDDPVDFSAVCSPAVIMDNRDAEGSGQLFEEVTQDPESFLQATTQAVCAILFRDVDEVVPKLQATIVVEDFDGIAGTSGDEQQFRIHLSSRHLQSLADEGSDLREEVTGIFHFQASFPYLYQGQGVPFWMVTGIADYVRHAAGYLPESLRSAGGSYTDGYRTTAFFLAWLVASFPDVVQELNQSFATGDREWSVDVFQELTGRDVDSLWDEYQQTL